MNWHTLPLPNVERELETDFHSGLDEAEALKRLRTSGPNRLPEGKREHYLLLFLRQFRSPLIYILLVVGGVVFWMGEHIDAAIIFFVLFFNAIVGSIQEGKAQNTLRALKGFVETTATVIRNGKEVIISDIEVVSGDIVVLHEGEKVAADARIVESRNLFVDEAALTGESGPVYKEAKVLGRRHLPIPEHTNMVFKGTAVTGGAARAVAVATGLQSEIGRISTAIASIDTDIPLKREIAHLSRTIIIVVVVMSASLFVLGAFFGKPLKEMFKIVVALSVSVIPEGLPIVLTLVLATGVWRMAKRNAVVKKLQAVEALGEAQIIAVDKTGTITRNEMVVREVAVGEKFFDVGGVGYEPKGEIRMKSLVVDAPNHQELILAGKVAAFCASGRAVFSEKTQAWKTGGDPTEIALFVFAEKVGFHRDDLEEENPLLAEMPFDYKTKYHAVAHKVGENELVTVAGAPESVLSLAAGIYAGGVVHPFTKERRDEAERLFHRMSASGLRVVAFAFSEDPAASGSRMVETLKEKNLTFGGFFGIEDSVRPEVPQAMARAREAGIRVVMITGDHRLTALAIGKKAGIWQEKEEVITGEELGRLPEEELDSRLPRTSIFARVSPDDKMKIIQAYRRRGEIVAMTGDGVNDAPSLVAADLGVAMGKIGTEVAKEAADIVLLDDNFGSIISAVEEGRSIYKTIKKVILYLFSTSAGEVLTIAGAIFLGMPIPVSAAQILWLNLVTDGFLDVALAMEPKEAGLLRGRFGKRDRFLVDWLMIERIVFMAIPMAIGTLYLFQAAYPHDLKKAMTVAVTALAIFQWFNAWNCRSSTKSLFQMSPFSNKFLIGATAIVALLQWWAMHNGFMQSILGLTPLTGSEWGIAIAVAFSIVVVEEVRKFAFRRSRKFPA